MRGAIRFHPPRQGVVMEGTFARGLNAVGQILARWQLATAAAFCIVLTLPVPALAQARSTGADLEGVVRDESGAVLPGALVRVVNSETDVARILETDADGRFRALSLRPGPYRISIDRSGFASHTHDGIELVLGQSVSLEFTMKLAAIEEGVTVNAETPVIEAGNTAVSTVVRHEQIQNLPINGRNFLSFSVMTPGVTTDRTPQQGATATSGLSFAGQRARSNNVMVDGFDNNDPTLGSVRATFSQEAIREFQVLTNAYSAEFGKAAGGVVNIVTRSGTNDLDGVAFGYFRDETLNAKDHFERFDVFGNRIERQKAPFGQFQWGGVLGGPIRKGKTFFFSAFERLDLDAHNFVTIDPNAADVLRANGFAVELGHAPYAIRTTDVLGKIDHQFSPTSALAVRLNVGSTNNQNIEPFGGLVARSRGAELRRDDLSLGASHTHILGRRWLNELRVQFARQDFAVQSLDPSCGDICVSDTEGGPTLELPGVASVGRQRFTPQLRQNDRYQVVDTLSFATRSHSIKAGLEVNHLDNRLASVPLHFGGRFVFAALPANPALGLPEPIPAVEALARGLPAAYIQGFGNPRITFGTGDVSIFLQDEWRIGKLLLKPGVRYQRQFWPEPSYDVSDVGGARLQYQIRQGGSFAPRMAAAYDLFGDGRTSIHGAFGRYDDYQVLASVVTGLIVNGSTGVRTLALRLPASIAAWNAPRHQVPEPVTAFPSVEISTTPDMKVPYALHTAIGIDRAVGSHASLSANYVRVRGRFQLAAIDYNPIVPSLGPGRRPNDLDGRPGTSASVLQYTPYGESWYDGVTLSLNQRFSGRHQLLVSYTLSKAEDTSTDFQSAFLPESNGFGRDPVNPTGLPIGFDPTRERGPSTHDQRHRLVVSGYAQLPYGLRGSAIVTAASGRPFTPLAGFDLNGDGDGGAFPPDRARQNPADPNSSVGRNSGIMPAQLTVDARVGKRFAVANGAAVELIAEAFNLFNRSNFSEVNNIFGRAAFPVEPQRDAEGRITYGLFEQTMPPRQIQLALRFTF
jgi:Carboxypeptidase regulatory-like domain/TonB-dependent Receptor Plug Domain